MSSAALSFVTTCKSRLHHLQQTLPGLVAQEDAQVVVVDYGCPQGAGDWVAAQFPSVVLVRVTDDSGLNLSRARNLGAAAATSDWLFFVDADVQVAAGFTAWATPRLRKGCFYVRERRSLTVDPGTWGSCICAREAFAAVGGYDEVMRGWGGEDDDLLDRLRRVGCAPAEYPATLVSCIDHGDDERVVHYEVKDKSLSSVIHRCYRRAKLKAMEVLGLRTELPLATRARLYESIRGAFEPVLAGQTASWPRLQFDIDAAEGLVLSSVDYAPRPGTAAPADRR